MLRFKTFLPIPRAISTRPKVTRKYAQQAAKRDTSVSYAKAACDWLQFSAVLDFNSAAESAWRHFQPDLPPQREGPVVDDESLNARETIEPFKRLSVFQQKKFPVEFRRVSRCFRYRNLEVAIASKPQTPDAPFQRAACVIATGDDCLCSDNIFGEAEGLMKALSRAGIAVRSTKAQRVDVCVDLAGIDLSWFEEARSSGRIGMRAKESFGYRDGGFKKRHTGFVVETKKPGLRLSIYDKLKKVRADRGKCAMMTELRWGGVEPNRAVRVEFQFGRERLHRFNIESFADVRRGYRSIATDIATRWLWVQDERERYHAVWKHVISALEDAVEGTTPLSAFTKQIVTDCDIERRQKQIIGALIKLAVAKGIPLSSTVDFGRYSRRWIASVLRHDSEYVSRRVREARPPIPSAASNTRQLG